MRDQQEYTQQEKVNALTDFNADKNGGAGRNSASERSFVCLCIPSPHLHAARWIHQRSSLFALGTHKTITFRYNDLITPTRQTKKRKKAVIYFRC